MEKDTHSKAIGYILWIFGFMGSHRFYYGRPITGTIWFFTLGLLFIGWIIDLFLIPSMDREADFRYTDGPTNYSVAWILLTFLGVFGLHRFYMGKWISGLVWLLTGGLLLLGVLYDYWTLNDQVSEVNRRPAGAAGRSARIAKLRREQGMKLHHVSSVAALALVLAAPGHAEVDPGIVERTLPNGLKIVVWPDHDIPNVAQYTWFRAGGRNEYPGITGLAHYFEHMMFNGTSNLAPGEFDRIMEAAGGANNAYTSNDVTVYQDWYPVSAIETIFGLEADRMANLDFDPEVVESERGVVHSERRTSVDNNNFVALMEQVQATAYLAHPYQFPVIGWPSDIENWRIEDLKTFYRTYYAPNNATMFVVGDVDPERVFALAEKHFAAIPSQPAPEPVTTVEPPQAGERRIVLVRPAQTPMLQIAWHSPRADDPAQPALDVLMTLLTEGESSRLHQVLVEQEGLAIEVGGYVHQGFDPGLAWIYAVLPPGGSAQALETRITGLLDAVAREGVSPAELAKAQNLLVADYWRGLSTISGKAQALGTYEVFHGDYRRLFEAPDAWEAVTGEDVRAVTARIFRTPNRTVGILEPAAAE